MTKKEEGPDQPRSWAIAMAGCVINSLMSGISRTTGLFYVALIETYGISRMEANMPFTMRNIVRNLSSPVAGAIGQRYGARDVTFIGGVLGGLGISLCCFAPSVAWITVLWGGMHGIGVALGNTLFPIIINKYFLRYRATASGLSLSGACVGSFILPFVVEYMLRNFGLPGTLLIVGGVILNVLPAALLMTEPSWIKRNLTINKKTENRKLKDLPPVQNLEIIREGVVETSSACTPSSGAINGEKKTDEDNVQVVTRSAKVFSRNGVDNPAFVGSKTDVSEKKVEELIVDEFQEIRMRTISIAESSTVLPNPLSSEIQETSLTKGIIILISNPMFHVISISLAGFALLFDPAITIIVDYVMDKGFEENDAKYFISMMSIGDLLGRLCFGWVTDKKYMTLAKFVMLLHVVQGISFLLLPLCQEFDIMIAMITVYGLASGANLVMYPLLVAKYLVSVQSLAIGCVAVFTGLVSFAVPPLIGYFRDNTGSYDGMFLITGGINVLIGFLWLFEPLLMRLQKSQRSVSITVNS